MQSDWTQQWSRNYGQIAGRASIEMLRVVKRTKENNVA